MISSILYLNHKVLNNLISMYSLNIEIVKNIIKYTNVIIYRAIFIIYFYINNNYTCKLYIYIYIFIYIYIYIYIYIEYLLIYNVIIFVFFIIYEFKIISASHIAEDMSPINTVMMRGFKKLILYLAPSKIFVYAI